MFDDSGGTKKDYPIRGKKQFCLAQVRHISIELAKAINQVFYKDDEGEIQNRESFISINDALDETQKAWFKRPYQKPYNSHICGRQ